MRQLSGHDASFLYLETPNAHMAGIGLNIYDQATAPGGRVTFKGILETVERRLHLAQSFRERLVWVPGNLDHPYWIQDRSFDLEFHVRHIALPRPGDWRQLCIQVARLLARPLDLSRPLWDMTVIEGLDDVAGVPAGSFAVATKMHHAAIDGMSGMELTAAIHDLAPEAEPPPPTEEWRPEPEPSQWSLLARANVNNLTRPMHFARVLGRTVPGLGRMQQVQRRTSGQSSTRVPRTRFNGTVSPHRVIEGRRFRLDDMKRMKASVDGATVNDVALTIVGGALRAYLDAKGELPAVPLTAMVPISVRTDEEKGMAGNKVSAMYTTLATDVPDPLARLEAVRAATRQAKQITEAVGARTLSEYSQFIPGGLAGLAARLSSRVGMANRANPPYNTVVSNMPGPQVPLYFAGARMVAQHGFGMIHDAMGLMHTVVSYCGDVAFSITSDRDMMPDPAFYAECLEGSYRDLAAATEKPAAARSR